MSSGDISYHSNGTGNKSKVIEKKVEHSDASLKLHKHPLLTISYAFMESVHILMAFISYVLSYKKILIVSFLGLSSLLSVNLIEGAHQKIIQEVLRKMQWWIWWVVLGFLSSCGFGSGLHTFVLYLGPFIARVTMAAYECGTVDFVEPPYPNEFICPEQGMMPEEMSTFVIVQKVLLVCILWGFGTAIGELPPYFMARAAALSGSRDVSDDSMWHKRAQAVMGTIVNRVGFIGIMLCASVPNPLFDLAGMTCGHFLIPFSTFFGATVIGKAFNKMMLQVIFVVFLFSHDKVASVQSLIKQIPWYGNSLHSLIEEFLVHEKNKIHSSIVDDKQGWLSLIFGYLQLIIILGFVISIVHSLADNYAARLQQWRVKYNERIDHSKLKN